MIFHNPWDLSDRRPFGAIPARERCFVRLRVGDNLPVNAAVLWFWYDDDPHRAKALPMTREAAPERDGSVAFSALFAPERPGLSFYRFELTTTSGETIPLSRDGATGVMTSGTDGPAWQLTVYDPSFTTPERFKGRVMYQIFPDRFCRSKNSPNTAFPERNLRDDWGGTPKYRPDRDGEYRPDDYFGGDLRGIESRLPYLKSLGVGIIYLNPIFEAHSNHRYDTADYLKIDPLLGDERDFVSLCRAAKEQDILIILDGVFSHTGADSRYFNLTGRYGEGVGAYRNPLSDEARWYQFSRYPDEWHGWWGINTLPQVHENRESWMRFVLDEGGVLDKWLSLGASGVRLDVADELPDVFLDRLRREVKRRHPGALILGEVWEDASTKISYGHRRRYLLGDQLDGVMNYPFRDAVIRFVKDGDGQRFLREVMTICEHYPAPALDVSMNMLSTHDTTRLLTVLAGPPAPPYGDTDWLAAQHLTGGDYARGVALAALAYAALWFLPGMPCIYYGDEAGMQGYRDPFCRGCFPWGEEHPALLSTIRRLGRLSGELPLLRDARFLPQYAAHDAVFFRRVPPNPADASLLIGISRTGRPVSLPVSGQVTSLWGHYRDGTAHFDSPGVFLAEISAPKEG